MLIDKSSKAVWRRREKIEIEIGARIIGIERKIDDPGLHQIEKKVGPERDLGDMARLLRGLSVKSVRLALDHQPEFGHPWIVR